MKFGKLFIFFIFIIIGFPDAVKAEGHRFVVLPFKNANNSPAMEFLTTAMPAEISRRLENYEKLHPAYGDNIFPPKFDFDFPLSTEEIGNIAKENKVEYIFSGVVYGPNWNARIVIDLISIRTGKPVWWVSTERRAQLESVNVVEYKMLDEMLFELLDRYDLAPDAARWLSLCKRPIQNHYAFVFLGRGIASSRGINREVNYDLAEEQFGIALRTEPKFGLVARFLGLMAREIGEEKTATRWFEEAAALEPNDYYSRLALAEINVANGDIGKALGYAKEASRIRPFEAMAAYQLIGELAFKLNQVDLAEHELVKALALEPGNLPARHLLAKIYAAKGEGKKLIAELEIIVGLSPRDISSNFALAAAYRRYNDDSRAVEMYKAIIGKDRKQVLAYRALGDLYRKAGDLENAAAIYAVAARIAPRDPRFTFLRGEIAFAKKDYRSADLYFRDALRFSKVRHFAENNLAVTYAASGDMAVAKLALSELVDRSPNYFLGKYNLAALMVLTAEATAAIPILEELRAIEPESSEICFALGLAYFARGNKGRSNDAFLEAVRLNPTDIDAQTDLAAAGSTDLPHKQLRLILDVPFSDATGLDEIFRHARFVSEEIEKSKAEFYAVAAGMQKKLEAAALLPQKKGKKRSCPLHLVNGQHKSVIRNYYEFINRGKSLEGLLEKLRLAEAMGEMALLTPDAATELSRLKAIYDSALTSFYEMRLVLTEELPAELEHLNCSSDLLIQNGGAEMATERATETKTPSPASEPSSVSLINIGAIFTVDNYKCNRSFQVYLDQKMIGTVGPVQKMSLRVKKGYHTYCVFEEGKNLRCGALGTIRHGYFESSFTVVTKCN